MSEDTAQNIPADKHGTHHRSTWPPSAVTPWLIVGIVSVLCVLSFLAGISFQKYMSKDGGTTMRGSEINESRFGTGDIGRSNGQRPIRGTVSVVTSSSITVKDTFSNTDTMYLVTSTTKISNNGQTAAVADIKAGDSVAVIISDNDTKEVAQIFINPSFGRGYGANPESSTTETQPPTSLQ